VPGHGKSVGPRKQPQHSGDSRNSRCGCEVRADHIIINGVVNGAVHAKMLLELQPKARIRGDVFYGALEMHEGALIDGRLTPMLPEEKHALKLAANNA